MTQIEATMTMEQLLQILADHHHKRIELSQEIRQTAIDLLKSKAFEELEYGQELKVDKVRVVKRVTGAVGVYFS